MHKLYREKSGFTLVELIIVIAIMGIIATLVIVANVTYRRNVENTQVATSVSAYQNAVSSIVSGGYPVIPDNYTESFARLHSCVSTSAGSDVCCFLYYVAANSSPQYGCGNNTTFNPFNARFGAGPASVAFPVGYTATQLSDRVRSYIPTGPQPLPFTTSVPDCTAATTLYAGSLPCAARQVGLQIDVATDYSIQPYLHYMLPVDMDCQSKDVVTPTPTPSGFLSTSGGDNFYKPIGTSFVNAKYSARNSVGSGKYTFCVVAVR